MQGFEILGKLGQGAYSEVFKVRRIADNHEYALKKVDLTKLDKKMVINTMNEVRILASINSPFVCGYKESFIDKETHCLCLVMEFIDGGDLQQSIQSYVNRGQAQIEEKLIWQVFVQMVFGLKELHSWQIMHRDLKSANIFLHKDGRVKIGDLNVSRVFSSNLMNYTQTGTPSYASPEVWNNDAYTTQSDIWSLGCILYELLTLKLPFAAPSMEQLYERVNAGERDLISDSYSQEIKAMVNRLLDQDADKRPSCEQIVQMSTFQAKIDELFPQLKVLCNLDQTKNNASCLSNETQQRKGGDTVDDLQQEEYQKDEDYSDSVFEKKLLRTIQVDGDMNNVFNSSMRDQLPRPAYKQNNTSSTEITTNLQLYQQSQQQQDEQQANGACATDSIYSSEKRFSDYDNDDLMGIAEAGSSYLDGTGLNNSEQVAAVDSPSLDNIGVKQQKQNLQKDAQNCDKMLKGGKSEHLVQPSKLMIPSSLGQEKQITMLPDCKKGQKKDQQNLKQTANVYSQSLDDCKNEQKQVNNQSKSQQSNRLKMRFQQKREELRIESESSKIYAGQILRNEAKRTSDKLSIRGKKMQSVAQNLNQNSMSSIIPKPNININDDIYFAASNELIPSVDTPNQHHLDCNNDIGNTLVVSLTSPSHYNHPPNTNTISGNVIVTTSAQNPPISSTQQLQQQNINNKKNSNSVSTKSLTRGANNKHAFDALPLLRMSAEKLNSQNNGKHSNNEGVGSGVLMQNSKTLISQSNKKSRAKRIGNQKLLTHKANVQEPYRQSKLTPVGGRVGVGVGFAGNNQDGKQRDGQYQQLGDSFSRNRNHYRSQLAIDRLNNSSLSPKNAYQQNPANQHQKHIEKSLANVGQIYLQQSSKKNNQKYQQALKNLQDIESLKMAQKSSKFVQNHLQSQHQKGINNHKNNYNSSIERRQHQQMNHRQQKDHPKVSHSNSELLKQLKMSNKKIALENDECNNLLIDQHKSSYNDRILEKVYESDRQEVGQGKSASTLKDSISHHNSTTHDQEESIEEQNGTQQGLRRPANYLLSNQNQLETGQKNTNDEVEDEEARSQLQSRESENVDFKSYMLITYEDQSSEDRVKEKCNVSKRQKKKLEGEKNQNSALGPWEEDLPKNSYREKKEAPHQITAAGKDRKKQTSQKVSTFDRKRGDVKQNNNNSVLYQKLRFPQIEKQYSQRKKFVNLVAAGCPQQKLLSIQSEFSSESHTHQKQQAFSQPYSNNNINNTTGTASNKSREERQIQLGRLSQPLLERAAQLAKSNASPHQRITKGIVRYNVQSNNQSVNHQQLLEENTNNNSTSVMTAGGIIQEESGVVTAEKGDSRLNLEALTLYDQQNHSMLTNQNGGGHSTSSMAMMMDTSQEYREKMMSQLRQQKSHNYSSLSLNKQVKKNSVYLTNQYDMATKFVKNMQHSLSVVDIQNSSFQGQRTGVGVGVGIKSGATKYLNSELKESSKSFEQQSSQQYNGGKGSRNRSQIRYSVSPMRDHQILFEKQSQRIGSKISLHAAADPINIVNSRSKDAKTSKFSKRFEIQSKMNSKRELDAHHNDQEQMQSPTEHQLNKQVKYTDPRTQRQETKDPQRLITKIKQKKSQFSIANEMIGGNSLLHQQNNSKHFSNNNLQKNQLQSIISPSKVRKERNDASKGAAGRPPLINANMDLVRESASLGRSSLKPDLSSYKVQNQQKAKMLSRMANQMQNQSMLSVASLQDNLKQFTYDGNIVNHHQVVGAGNGTGSIDQVSNFAQNFIRKKLSLPEMKHFSKNGLQRQGAQSVLSKPRQKNGMIGLTPSDTQLSQIPEASSSLLPNQNSANGPGQEHKQNVMRNIGAGVISASHLGHRKGKNNSNNISNTIYNSSQTLSNVQKRHRKVLAQQIDLQLPELN